MIKNMRQMSCYLLLLSIICLPACEQASGPATGQREVLRHNEYSKQFPPYTIHVNALTTDQLTSEVAKAYQIARSENRVILNVSITKSTDSGQLPVPATVKATVRNLNSQFKPANIHEIIDSGQQHEAIYYIAQFQVTNGETLVFDLDIAPENISHPYALSFRKTFFTE